MKKTIIFLLPVFLTISALAQPPHGKGQMQGPPPHRGEGIKKELNLTPEQQAQEKKLQESFHKQMKALNENESITVKEQRDKREQLMRQHRADMEKILTPEQKKQLADSKESAKKIASHQSAIQLEKMKTELNLSNEQVTALQAHREKTMAQMKALHENESLDRTDRKAKMEAIMKESKASMDKLLTKEQQAKWQEMRKDRMHQGRRQGPGKRQGPPPHGEDGPMI